MQIAAALHCAAQWVKDDAVLTRFGQKPLVEIRPSDRSSVGVAMRIAERVLRTRWFRDQLEGILPTVLGDWWRKKPQPRFATEGTCDAADGAVADLHGAT